MARLSLNSSRKTKTSAAGEIPVDWGCVRLADVLDKSLTYGVVQPGEHVTGGLLLIRSQDYSRGWASIDSMMRISREIEAPYERSRVKTGDILITVVGANIGKIAIVPEHLNGANISRSVARVSVDTGLVYSSYVKAFLDGGISRLLHLNQNGGAQPVLNLEDLRDFALPLPPIPEQKKIADILGTWDQVLEKLDVLIAAKDRRNQALMQQLLAVAAQKIGHGHARHRLGEVVERVTRKNSIENENVLTISAQDGLINQREYFNRSVAGANLAGYFLLRRGEFAYNRSSSIGFPYGAIKRLDRYDAGIVSTLYLCFRIQDGAKVSSDYLAHYLDGGFLNSGLRSIAKEGARAHGLLNVTADEFLDIDIFLPPLPLQTKIAAVLDTADAELRLLRQQRTALDQQKRGLMQRLLTGTIRVSP